MTVSIKELNQLDFTATHQISLSENGLPRFSELKDAKHSDAPSVYLWLIKPIETDISDSSEVLRFQLQVQRLI